MATPTRLCALVDVEKMPYGRFWTGKSLVAASDTKLMTNALEASNAQMAVT